MALVYPETVHLNRPSVRYVRRLGSTMPNNLVLQELVLVAEGGGTRTYDWKDVPIVGEDEVDLSMDPTREPGSIP